MKSGLLDKNAKLTQERKDMIVFIRMALIISEQT
jgi:hypothetical protein